MFGIGKADTTRILDILIGCTDDRALDGLGFTGKSSE
jgi:hypothetical protein